MSKRRQDQIQHGIGKPADTSLTAAPGAANSPALSGETADGMPVDTNVLGKYWIAIILWGASFTLMIVFEILSAVFRR